MSLIHTSSEWPLFWRLSFISFAILAILIQKLLTKKTAKKGLVLPPGPTGLPILGNLLQLGSNPNQELHKLSVKYGPLITLRMGRQITVVATSAEMAEKILKTHDETLCGRHPLHIAESESHWQRNISMLQMGPRWSLHKKMSVTNLFSSTKLDSLRHLRHNEVHRTLAGIHNSGNKAVDIKHEIFVYTFNLMANTIFGEEMFGGDSDELKEYQGIVQEAISVIGTPNLSDFFPILRWIDPQGLKRRADKVFGRLYKAMEMALQTRLDDPNAHLRNDLLASLLESRSPEFSNWDVLGLVCEMFIASTITPGIAVQWAMAELMKNPSCMKKCVAEIDGVVGSKSRRITEEDALELPYLKAVLKEVFRLHPPAPFLIPHKAEEDTRLDDGYLIPKDAQVIVNVWGIGRDPKLWKTADVFDPERFLNENRDIDFKGHHFELLPFGGGRRACTGMPLAIRMTFYVLASLLQCFDWSLPPWVCDIDMTERLGNMTEMAVPLPLIAKSRLPAHLY